LLEKQEEEKEEDNNEEKAQPEPEPVSEDDNDTTIYEILKIYKDIERRIRNRFSTLKLCLV
jgi:hypothetical protein